MTLRDYIKQAGYDPVPEEHYTQIGRWKEWYRGKVASFHPYVIYSGGKELRRERSTLNMAKQGCEFWANLLWNNKCAVNLKKDADDEFVNNVLAENDFTRQANVLIERAWALGSGAFVVFQDRGNIRIDYVPADMIFPLSWRGDTVDSCAFAAAYNQGADRLMYMMIHEQLPTGGYKITNQFFRRKEGSEDLTPIPAPAGILDTYHTAQPRFAIVRPNIANNTADVPLGISVYANSIDTLKSIDLAYDGAKTSMEIGRPRIGVTSDMITVDKSTGELREMFDAKDIAVYSLGDSGGKNSTTEVKDLTTQYRATEFEQSLQTQLMIYAQCIGLGENTFKWDRAAGDVAKTATEVIYSNSTMVRTMEKHQDGLRSAIIQLVRAILDIGSKDAAQDISVIFDDSASRDRGQEAMEAWQWVVSGYYPFWRYLVDFKGYDQAEAKEIAGEAQAAVDVQQFEGTGEE